MNGLSDKVEMVERVLEAGNPEDLEDLVNMYLLLSEIKSEADNSRKKVSEELGRRETDSFETRLGSISRVTREYVNVNDESEVFEKMEEKGINPKRFMKIDPKKVRQVAREEGLDEDELVSVSESSYYRRESFNGDLVDEATRSLLE